MIFLFLLVLLVPTTAMAQCSQANSECNPKTITGVITNVPPSSDAQSKGLTHVTTEVNTEWNAKIVTNVVTISEFVGNAKHLVHVVVIPGMTRTYPVTSPRTHP